MTNFNTAHQIKKFLTKGNDAWYGSILDEVLNSYQNDMTIEEIDEIIKEEVNSLQQGYEEWSDENV